MKKTILIIDDDKSKSPDFRQPGCPDEKVKAIEAALSYFQMI